MVRTHEQVAQWQNALAPHIVERLAREIPDNKYGEWVNEDNVLDDPGRYGANPEVLAYIGTNDLFIISPRNSPAAHCALFDHLKCQTLITSNAIPPPTNVILNAVKPLHHFIVLSIEELLNQQYPHYVLSKTFEDLRQTAIVVMVRFLFNYLSELSTVPGMQELEEYSTKDLFESHPQIPNLWCWRARSDDIIVFLNGEKINLISMEQYIIVSNSEVSGAFVIGVQRFQGALLIELASVMLLTIAEQAILIEYIWSSIEESNCKAFAHMRLEKSFVLHLHSVMAWSNLDDTDNLFDRDIDLLQYLQLTCALQRSFQYPDFAISTIYQNPTVSQLRTAILTPNKNEQNELQIMEALIITYCEQIKTISVPKKPFEYISQALKPINALLTGSTGTIGSYLLQALLNRDGIAYVFCLNSGEDGEKSKQHKIFTAFGFATTEPNNRVTFIKADLESPSVGIDENTYKSLGEEIDLIIHTAWPVNFNLVLSASRPQFAGIVNLLILAASTNSITRFIFISSIAAVERYTAGPALEEIIFNIKTLVPFGYAHAKLLFELLVNAAGPRFDNVDFIPVDLLGDIFIDLVMTRKKMSSESASATTVFNLWNPQQMAWSTMLRTIVEARSVEIVEPEVWIDSLRMSSEENGVGGDGDGDVEKNPAVKLLDFLTGLCKERGLDAEGGVVKSMLVESALDASPKMRGLEAMRGKWVSE
ncbi:hypothetical protein BOTCAL_0001g00280 [Botryotinia calthae]|uniref:Thioester reductase (TE) domain-containing protein n=1 Tax=Botryotinia calthae TaxID=38488 RepID=A0A4Y8DKP8_9HELO|nr:hypothetical protein BOTCAL_0001g00280 [Botryotinia calthae]